MIKINADNISIIMSVMVDSEDRVANLKLNILFFSTYFSNYELVIVEQGASSRLAEILKSQHIIYFFVPSAGCHHKTRNLNLATNLATRNIIMMIDVDVIFHPLAYQKALELLYRGASFVAPYNGIVTEIKKSFFVNGIRHIVENLIFFPKSFNKNLSEFDYSNMQPMFGNSHYDNTGGCLIYTKKAFYVIGGWNTNFVSYGFEDMEFVYRINKFGFKLERLDDFNIYHFQHNRSYDSYYNNFYRVNEEEWIRVRGLTKTELLIYIHNGFKKLVLNNLSDTLVINTEEKYLIEQLVTKKYDLMNLSIIIPLTTVDSNHRRLLNKLILFFEINFNNYELILVEAGTRRCKYLRNKKNVKYFWLGILKVDPIDVINHGLAVSKGKIKTIWDTNKEIEPYALFESVRAAVDSGSNELVTISGKDNHDKSNHKEDTSPYK